MKNPIRLEDDWEPSWDDAKTRLKVAAEVYGFPFTITLDEAAYAYKDMEHFMNEQERDEDERTGVAAWWKDYAHQISSYEQGLRVLYPWFHDGEQMPLTPTV